MDESKQAMIKAYPEFPDWKEDSDKLFGAKEAIEVWKSLAEFLPPPESDLIVLGASENIPTHLVAIWKTAIEGRSGKVNFLVGDIGIFSVEDLLNHAVKPNITERHAFNVFQWDAENLPVKKESVDVIFDRAGWLWHCIRIYKDETRLMNSLIQYYQLLKDEGVVVIDAIEGFDEFFKSLPKEDQDAAVKILEQGYHRPSEIFKNPPGQYQPSTVDVIREGTSGDFWFYVGRFFEINDIGEGVARVRVLKKKARLE